MQSLLIKQHKEELKLLTHNNDILLTRPDKGPGVVIVDRKDYIEKMSCLLSDSCKLSKSNEKNRTELSGKQLTEVLNRMKNNHLIHEELYEKIRPTGSLIPRLYGLPKIHKAGLPLRPVLDMSGSP
ncbi:unnamed protein product [Trichobilharzia regenti]|nr:unnamed protein product [Trichobilharzia regenti]